MPDQGISARIVIFFLNDAFVLILIRDYLSGTVFDTQFLFTVWRVFLQTIYPPGESLMTDATVTQIL